MRVGDLLEWTAAGLLVAAAYLWLHSLALALLVGALCLVYFAQCLATKELPKLKLPKPRLHLPSPKIRARIVVSARLWRATHSR